MTTFESATTETAEPGFPERLRQQSLELEAPGVRRRLPRGFLPLKHEDVGIGEGTNSTARGERGYS